ncbi:MAG: phytanoyl-CoA dioxygenase family protein [Armatimonadota bacterium]|nr:phytanoyl-CoA dioxygenase family protein [Armatimonadota bacterium]
MVKPQDLYAPEALVEGVTGLDAVGEAEIVRYHDDGFLVVHGAFTASEVDAARAGLAHLIMGGCPAFEDIQFEASAAARLPELTLDERQDAVRKLMCFSGYEPRLNALAAHPALLAILTRLLGDTPRMFQDMALLKPPQIGREKPWHQDKAYFDLPLGAPVVGVWIALDPATVENGCMRLWPGGHKEGARPHFQRRDWQICDTDVQGRPCVAAPLAPGGLLLFDGLVPHGTPANSSAQRRRAVQFHYAPASASPAPPDERLAVFGSEGKNVSC